MDIACCLYNFTSAPVYDTYGEESTLFMFEITELETLALTYKHLNGIIEMKN